MTLCSILYIVQLVICDEFWRLLQKRPESSTDTISDIYDGAEYSRLCQSGGFLCHQTNPANISSSFNSDGVYFIPLKLGYPIYLVIIMNCHQLQGVLTFIMRSVILLAFVV